ncbi:MAG TPA: hypothetical protein VFI61_03960 [Patescibacteria group bacterium]|nr:hypothetical protein [Patescibacteria group bacterium]
MGKPESGLSHLDLKKLNVDFEVRKNMDLKLAQLLTVVCMAGYGERGEGGINDSTHKTINLSEYWELGYNSPELKEVINGISNGNFPWVSPELLTQTPIMVDFLTEYFNFPVGERRLVEGAILEKTGYRLFYDFSDRVDRFMYTHKNKSSNMEGFVALAWKNKKLSGFLSVVAANDHSTLVDLLSSPSFFTQTHHNPQGQVENLLSKAEQKGIDISAPYETDPEAIMVSEKGSAVWPVVLLMGRFAAMDYGCRLEIAHSLETGVYNKEPAMIFEEKTDPHTGNPLLFGIVDLQKSHEYLTKSLQTKLGRIS